MSKDNPHQPKDAKRNPLVVVTIELYPDNVESVRSSLKASAFMGVDSTKVIRAMEPLLRQAQAKLEMAMDEALEKRVSVTGPTGANDGLPPHSKSSGPPKAGPKKWPDNKRRKRSGKKGRKQ